MYNYFRLELNFRSSQSYKAGIKFLKSLDIYSPDLFKSVRAYLGTAAYNSMVEFFLFYEQKGFSKKGITIDVNAFKCSLSFKGKNHE
jgi:hypothetical protein